MYKYLSHPLKNHLGISEGWIYSKAERDIHKNYFHHGIDYETNYGTPVYACADGIAVASYHRFPLNDKFGFPLLYEGKPISNGLGLFVQIYHPEDISKVIGGTITQYGHLSRLAKPSLLKRTTPITYDLTSKLIRRNSRKRKINRLSDVELENKAKQIKKIEKQYPWIKKIYGFSMTRDLKTRESYLYTPEDLSQLLNKKSTDVMCVKKGEVIGYTGLSSVFYGNCPYDEDTFIEVPNFTNSWDEIHLHFEVAQRNWKTGAKVNQIDPYNIYKSVKWYKAEKLDSIFF